MPQRRTLTLLLLLFLLIGGRPAAAYVGNVKPLIPYDSGVLSHYSIATDFTNVYANDNRFMYRQLVNFLNQHLLHSTYWFHMTVEPVTYPSAGRTLSAGMYYKGNPWYGGAKPLVIYAHGSEFNRNKVPSLYGQVVTSGGAEEESHGSVETPLIMYYAMKLNAAVLALDYPGMGGDRGIAHPYCQFEPLSKAVLDAIPVGLQKMEELHLAWDGRVLVTGYSEGGYAAAAALKKYHEDPSYLSRLPHNIVFAPGAGPYDMTGAMAESMFSDANQHPNPWYLPYLVNGWNHPVLSMEYVFQPWLWGMDKRPTQGGPVEEPGMEVVYDNDEDATGLNFLLKVRSFLHTGGYSTARLLTDRVKNEQYDPDLWPDTDLGRWLSQNDLHAGSWWISSPTYLFANSNDDNVPYTNHTSFLNHMRFRKADPGIVTEQTNDILTLPDLDLGLQVVAYMGHLRNDEVLNGSHPLGGIVDHVQTADYFASIPDWNARWPSAIDFPKNNVDVLGIDNKVTIRYRAPFHGPQVWIGASYDGATNWRMLYQGPNKGSFTFTPRSAGLTTAGPLVIAVKDLDADNPEHDWNRNRVLYTNTRLVSSQLRLTEPAAGVLLSTDPWCTLPMTWTGAGPVPLRAEARLVGSSNWTVVGRYQGSWTTGGRNLFPSITTPGDYDVRLAQDDASGNASAPVRVRVIKAVDMAEPSAIPTTWVSWFTPFVGETPPNVVVKLINAADGSARTIYSGPVPSEGGKPGIRISFEQQGLSAGKTYVLKMDDKATGYGMGHSNQFTVYSPVSITSPKNGVYWSHYVPLPVTWTGSGNYSISWSPDGTKWSTVGVSSTGSATVNAMPKTSTGKLYVKIEDTANSANKATVWVTYY